MDVIAQGLVKYPAESVRGCRLCGEADLMMDWQSRDDDRNAHPDWQADWQRGHEIGALIVVGLALVMAVVSILLNGW